MFTLKFAALHRSRLLAPLAVALALAGSPRWAASAAADDPPVGWWRDATFYEIFVRSFADAQAGPLAGDGVGDLQGLIDHLDYLNDGRGAAGASLGVTALWLMPIQPSPSYHGYDVTDYFAVNPSYGDVALMKKLLAEAHRRGLRVIVDLVLNHASAQHPQFQQALSRDPAPAAAARRWFRFADEPEDLAGPWGARAWHPAANGGFYYGVFSAGMPDWNLREPAVTEHHRRVAAFWLQDVGVDGFRLDAVRYFVETGGQLQDTEETRRWLRDFTAYCHSLKPGAFVIGEDTADLREVARCIRGGSLDSAFEFDLAKATIESVRLRTPALLVQTLGRLRELYGNDCPWATFLSNHDQERTLTQLDGDPTATRLAAGLLFTLPGVPFVYYGEELGLSGAKPDPELRTPLPWTAEVPNAGFTAPGIKPWHALTGDIAHVNVATEAADPASLLAWYRRLVRLRANSPALRHGGPADLAADDRQSYAALRETEDEAVLILANLTPRPRAGPALTLGRSRIRPSWSVREELVGANISRPQLTADGGFVRWMPLAELAPESVYVIRWVRSGTPARGDSPHG
jgi:alpha-amylase